MKLDNSTAISTNDKPYRLVIPLMTSATVKATMIADKNPTLASTPASIFFDPSMNGCKLVMKSDKSVPILGI